MPARGAGDGNRPPLRAPTRPRLKPAVEVKPASDGRIYLLRGECSDDFAVADSPAVRTLLGALDGSRSPGQAASLVTEKHADSTGAEVMEAIAQLTELGVVEDAADDDVLPPAERLRYERQLRYFSEVVGPGESRAAPQIRLRESRVVMLGVGGLGSWTAYALACAGVGRIDIVDGDRVELSNLNRQILYRTSAVGEPKAEAAARTLREFNPGLEIRSSFRRLSGPDEVNEAISGADLVVDAADWPAHQLERWINKACFAAGIPFIMMSQLPPLARIGPLFVPGQTGCYKCVEDHYRKRHPLYDELTTVDGLLPSPAAAFGPGCGLIGSQVATDVVHYLTGLVTPGSLGCALTIDTRTLEVTREPVRAVPGCAICGGSSARSGES